MRTRTSLAIGLLTLLAAASRPQAQCPPTRLTSPHPAPAEFFGESCALDGDVLLVGASQFGSAEGFVTVLRSEGGAWVFEDELGPLTSPFGQGFGFHVDADGGHAIVSAPCTSTCTSALEFFERCPGAPTSWKRTTHVPFDVRRESGHRVALSGDRAVATRGSAAEVVVFERAGGSWLEEQVIAPPAGHTGGFGASIALDGDLLVVSGGGHTYLYRDAGLGFFLDDELLDAGGSPVEGSVAAAEVLPFPYVAVATDLGVHVFAQLLQPFPNPPIWVADGFAPAPTGSFGFRTLALSPPSVSPFAPLRVAVGDRLASSDRGVVWVFEDDGSDLVLRQRLVQPNTRYFGFDVSMDARRLATGTWAADEQGQASLSAWGSAWTFELAPAACPLACTSPRLPDVGALAGEERGRALALLGDVALVGAPRDDTLGSDAGAVHLFRRIGSCWTREETLFASDAAAGDRFGHALGVDASGTRLVVGAPGADGTALDSGAAYVFRDLGGGLWVESAVLAPTPQRFEGAFGSAVDIDAFQAVIGEPGAPGSTADRAQVFQDFSGSWVQVATLLPFLGGGGFGEAVAIADLNVVVGAPADDDAGPDAGAVYSFTGSPFGTWPLSQKLAAPQGASMDAFGASVDLEIAPGLLRLVVGAPGAEAAGLDDAGRAYVYESGFGLQLVEVLGAEAPTAGARLGSAVALDGDRVVAGAPDAAPGRGGRAHAFLLGGPGAVSLGSIGGGGTSGDSEFGAAVTLEDDLVLVGAPRDSAGTGSAWARTLAEFVPTSSVVRDATPSRAPSGR